ncbi:MAG: ferritin [Anaerolineales bacterium]
MISKKMQDAINEQIKKEQFSSYLYLSMVAYFEEKNLPGIAKWLRLQSGEETEHAMKFFDYLVERGGRVKLAALEEPKAEWTSSLNAFEEVLKHEQFISASINSLYELALAEKDYPTQVLLQWFISEQVEEESNANEIISKLKMIEDKGTAVLMLDKEMGKRD